MGSFQTKKLKFVITLANGSFGSSKNNTLTLIGLRAIVDIDNAHGPQIGRMTTKIYGVSKDDMISITTWIWDQKYTQDNRISIYAIDGDFEALIFDGNIIKAWGDFKSIPNSFLFIQGLAGYFKQLTPVPPRSYKGTIDVATIMNEIALSAGFLFENNNVNIKLKNVYLYNTAMEQMNELAKMARCGFYKDPTTHPNTIVITQDPFTPRNIRSIPLISRTTGLIGYPTFSETGIDFSIYFNPNIFMLGKVKVESDITMLNGIYRVDAMSHHLECEKPDGAWFTQIHGGKHNVKQ